MSESATPSPAAILKEIAARMPDPWFPAQSARASGIPRTLLDEPLNQLRLAGILRLTDWQAGKGQGYVLTDAGRKLLDDPKWLARVEQGQFDPPPSARPSRAPRANNATWDRGEALRETFLNPPGTPVTYALVILQALVFGFCLMSARQADVPLNRFLSQGLSPLLDRLAVNVPGLLHGDWWRLISYSVVHVGALHLMLNLAALLSLGPVTEQIFGSSRFLLLWCYSALGGGCAAVLAGGPGAAGASGAICGLIAALTAFLWLSRQHFPREWLREWRGRLTSVILLTVLISLVPNVSWSAHLGGALVGFATACLLYFHRFGNDTQRWICLLGLLLAPVFCVAPLVERGYLRMPRTAAEEQDDLLQRVIPLVRQVRDLESELLDQQIDPLRDRPPGERDPDALRRAVEALAIVHNQILTARHMVASTGPYGHEPWESWRLTAEALLRKQMQVNEAFQHCLQRGKEWGQAEESQLQELRNAALEADLAWRKSIRAALAGSGPHPAD